MKTLIAAGALMFSGAGPLQANSTLVTAFAECAGRYSAEMEHAWLMGTDNADRLQSTRITFVSLLEATVFDDERRSVLSYRIETKLAHAALLTMAAFGADETRARTARRLADGHLQTCQRMLLNN